MKDAIRLLSIIPCDWGIFLKAMYAYISWGIYPVLNVFMFTRITYAIEQSDYNLLTRLVIIYLILVVFVWLRAYSARYWGRIEVIGGYSKILHRKYMTKFVYLNNVGYEKIGTGKLINIIDKGIYNWGAILDYSFSQITAFVIILLYVIYVLRTLGIKYLLIFLLLFLIITLFSVWMNKGMLLARKDRVTAMNSYARYLVKIIMSKYETMQVGLRGQDLKRLDGEQDNAINANRNMQPYAQLFFWVPALIVSLLKILILLTLGVGIINQTSSYTDLVAVGTGLGLLENLMGRRLKFYKDATKDLDIVKRMRETFDSIGMMEGYNKGDNFEFEVGNIKINNNTYAYDQDNVFSHFSLDIQGSKKTALVGKSGSGKSTLVKLIAGYLRPDSGSILVDGQDLREVSLKSYYKHIGYLTQEPSVFDGTVMENLTYAIDGEVDQALLDQAIRYAKCEFVYDFPDGLQTEIGERGIRLSGGQRQRLAIAKIFLKDPKIIILDEPTSALDSFSEEAITEAMHKLFEGRTVIIIAHRLQTVKQADDIILLEDGKVVERGTHDELVASGGQYAKMLELQSGF